AGIADEPDHGAHVHDPAPPLFHHGPGEGADAEKAPLQIGVDDLIPILLAQAHDQIVARDTRVIHEDVGPAERLERFGAKRVRVPGLRHVPLGPDRVAPLRAKLGARPLERRSVPPRDDDPGAAARQPRCDRAADSFRPAGHDRDPFRETPVAHAATSWSAWTAASAASGSSLPKSDTSRSTLFTRPRRTRPWPTSTNRRTPSSTIARTVCSHSTGWRSCSRSAARISSGACTGRAETLAETGNRAGRRPH